MRTADSACMAQPAVFRFPVFRSPPMIPDSNHNTELIARFPSTLCAHSPSLPCVTLILLCFGFAPFRRPFARVLPTAGYAVFAPFSFNDGTGSMAAVPVQQPKTPREMRYCTRTGQATSASPLVYHDLSWYVNQSSYILLVYPLRSCLVSARPRNTLSTEFFLLRGEVSRGATK